jgi:hypothetical protein
MAKIKDVTLSFPASASTDVVNYKLYYVKAATAPDYNSPFVTVSGTSILLNSVVAGIDGNYSFGVTAVDGFGNESDMSTKLNFPLDLTPPAKPGALVIV